MKPLSAFTIALSSALALAAQYSAAQDYPNKSIRLVVPFPPGGAVDIMGRLIAEYLSERFKQQVIVDNRSGATGAIAMNIVAAAAPDGYTIIAVSQAFWTHQSIFRDFPYDVRKDFTPIILNATFPLVLVVNPAVQAHSVKELIELAKNKPDTITYGDNGGIGSSGHIAGELFNQRTGLRITHVPYKGGGPMYVDLLGGQIQMSFAHITSVLPFIKAGRVRPLTETGTSRLPVLPEVPTLMEAGFPDFSVVELSGVIGPGQMSRPVVRKLNSAIVELMNSSAMRSRLISEGAQIVAGTPDQFADLIKSEVPKIASILQRAGVKRGGY
jgi:tripartite-type tricarboxylate transporter receptor subunit TctC